MEFLRREGNLSICDRICNSDSFNNVLNTLIVRLTNNFFKIHLLFHPVKQFTNLPLLIWFCLQASGSTTGLWSQVFQFLSLGQGCRKLKIVSYRHFFLIGPDPPV